MGRSRSKYSKNKKNRTLLISGLIAIWSWSELGESSTKCVIWCFCSPQSWQKGSSPGLSGHSQDYLSSSLIMKTQTLSMPSSESRPPLPFPHPSVAGGLTMARSRHPEIRFEEIPGCHPLDPHHILIGTGYIGVYLFILFLLSTTWRKRKNDRQNSTSICLWPTIHYATNHICLVHIQIFQLDPNWRS